MDVPRNTERSRSMLGAHIIFNNRNSTLDCQVRNISATGARLVLSEAVALPEEFELFVPQKGKTYRARLRWRNAEGAGVELIHDSMTGGPVKPGAEDLPLRMAQLENENALLRLQIVDLTRRLSEKLAGAERAA